MPRANARAVVELLMPTKSVRASADRPTAERRITVLPSKVAPQLRESCARSPGCRLPSCTMQPAVAVGRERARVRLRSEQLAAVHHHAELAMLGFEAAVERRDQLSAIGFGHDARSGRCDAALDALRFDAAGDRAHAELR